VVTGLVFIELGLVSQIGGERHVSQAEGEFQRGNRSVDRLTSDGKE
jgi:hypothetical protein